MAAQGEQTGCFEVWHIEGKLEEWCVNWQASTLGNFTQALLNALEIESEPDNLVVRCASRQANRMLNKLRGGNISRVTFREQILSLLADGEEKGLK